MRIPNSTLRKGTLLASVLLASLTYGADAAVCDGLGCVFPNTPGKATGGGQVPGEMAELAIVNGTAAGGRANFGFNAQYVSGDPAPSGHLTFLDHDTGKKVKSTSIDSFTVAGSTAIFTGQATVNGTAGVGFFVEVEDFGEPGRADAFRITLGDGYAAGGVLLRGNIQVREGNPPDGEEPPGGAFLIGAAKRTLNPTLEVAPPDGQVFLGGYGLGATRRSTGVMGSGAWVRAFVVDNGQSAIALVESDNQGTFVAYQIGRAQAGTIDIAKAVEAARPGLRADHIVIASDHSHAGQDLVGVWGGVPNEYLEFVKEQTVAAIVEAYDRREPANLLVGSVGGIVAGDASSILNSQFDDSSCTPNPTPEDSGHTKLPCTEPGDFPNWDLVDASVRVLRATRPDGSTIATFVNFAAHATVMGSGNHLISPDWPGPTAEKLEDALGGTAVVMPGTNGRTQPDRGSGSDPEKLDAYSTTVSSLALQAVTGSIPVSGNEVAAKKRLIFEVADNAGLLALTFAGGAGCTVANELCIPIMRANTPPWISGDVIGTVVSAVRIGNVLFTGTPGEPYPQIAFGIQQAVDAGIPGAADITHHFQFSLADDQIGYLIAPTKGVPFAAEKTALTGNDNFLFNVAATVGDHVMCTAIDLAIDIGLSGNAVQDPRCTAWIAEPDINPVTLGPNQ
jgi:hypothetical protein